MTGPRNQTPAVEQELPERMSPISLQTTDDSEPAGDLPTPATAGVEHETSNTDYEPADSVYQTLYAMSISQLLFMVISTPHWSKALQWFLWDKNPIEAGRSTWMFEALCLSSAHLGVLFCAVAAGLGMWIGTTWRKAKQDPAVFHKQVCALINVLFAPNALTGV